MTTKCTTKRTVTWRTMPKSNDDSDPVAWKCKCCGAHLGNVQKDNRGWHYLTPSDRTNIHCYGDAEITCQFCGVVRKWFWNEHALKRVLRARALRV